MKKQLLLTVLLTSGAFLLSGCSNNAQNGALIGSLAGAALGKSTSNHRDKRAAIGAVLGGAVGAAIGNEKDRAQRSRNTTYSNAPVQSTTGNYNNSGNVKHTHHYSANNSQTHTHSGGNVKHSHDYNYSDSGNYYQPANVSTSLYISGGSYRHRPRYYNHRHHRPHHRRTRWY